MLVLSEVFRALQHANAIRGLKGYLQRPEEPLSMLVLSEASSHKLPTPMSLEDVHLLRRLLRHTTVRPVTGELHAFEGENSLCRLLR